jgi:hypothetical protein
VKSTFDPARYQLTEAEAFRAMRCFLEQFFRSAGNDVATLLVDISIVVGNEPWQPDGSTHDPAAWDDWLKCVDDVAQAGDPPPAG